MSSSSMAATAASVQPAHVENDRQPSTERQDRSASQNLHLCTVQATAASPERRDYNFGTGLRRDAAVPESPRASRTVPGVSFADTGFEVVDGQDVFVAWFACPLDACDALKTASEGKIVRCGDRALIKVKNPRRLGR